MIIVKLECKRCKHDWFPRTEKKPVLCPRCKSPSWDKDRKVKKP